MNLQDIKIPKVNVPFTKNVDLGWGNYTKDNTPPKLKKAANIVLKVAALGVIVGGFMKGTFNLPIGAQIVLYSGSVGTLFKEISRLFGIKTDK